MNLRILLLPTILCCVVALPASADETAPANLANACAACHGPDGASPGAIPAINELTPDQLITILTAFRNDELVVTVMNRIAKGYTDAEIVAIARYLGEL